MQGIRIVAAELQIRGLKSAPKSAADISLHLKHEKAHYVLDQLRVVIASLVAAEQRLTMLVKRPAHTVQETTQAVEDVLAMVVECRVVMTQRPSNLSANLTAVSIENADHCQRERLAHFFLVSSSCALCLVPAASI